MRRGLAAVFVLLILMPSIASAGAHTGRCRTLGRQIVQYGGFVEMAEQRGDEMWKRSNEAHIQRLQNKMYSLCPHLKPNPGREFAIWLRKTANMAIDGAKKYYTGGFW